MKRTKSSVCKRNSGSEYEEMRLEIQAGSEQIEPYSKDSRFCGRCDGKPLMGFNIENDMSIIYCLK
jgi:hypothetical protein